MSDNNGEEADKEAIHGRLEIADMLSPSLVVKEVKIGPCFSSTSLER